MDSKLKHNLNRRVVKLKLQDFSREALRNIPELRYVGQLAAQTAQSLTALLAAREVRDDLRRRIVEDVELALQKRGITLGTVYDDWTPPNEHGAATDPALAETMPEMTTAVEDGPQAGPQIDLTIDESDDLVDP